MQTNLRIDQQVLAVEHEHSVSGMIELTAPEASTARRPLHLALVIDRSGSMAGDKLEAAKAAARFLVQRLGADDRLAIVAFDDEVDLALPLGAADPAQAEAAIERIYPGGSTNLSGGWLKGLEELGRGAGVDATRRVLLLTDGRANVGIVDHGELVSLAGGTKAQTATTTIGFGAGFDEDLLQQIADGSGGASYYVETPEDAPGVFAEEFEGLATIVAQNLSVEITTTDDVKLLGVLNDYPVVEVAGGLQVQLGDIFGGERRRVVFQMAVPGVAQLGVRRIAEIVVRYAETGAQVALHETTVPVTVNLVSADEAAAVEADHDVVEQVTILLAAKARREARDLADGGDYDGAHRLLSFHSAQLRAVGSMAADVEAELLEGHSMSFAASTYDPSMRKRLTTEAYRAGRGRSNKKRSR